MKADPLDILGLTKAFPDQCRRAIQLGTEVDLNPVEWLYNNVLLAGMGGSAAAGEYLQAIFDLHGQIPFQISRDYSIPSWVNETTLVICSSHSGNTEETLSAYERAVAQGARILVVTSGGEVAKRAIANGNALLQIPGGQPPRTALGYMFFGPLLACIRLGLLRVSVDEGICSFLDECVAKWGQGQSNEAVELAQRIARTVPVTYGLGSWQGAVAKRWKAQFNENAKAPAFAHTFPELMHNEVLGWIGANEPKNWSCLVLADGEASGKMQERARLTLESLPDGVVQDTIYAPGTTLLQKMLGLSLFGDFVSVYMAYELEVDPGDISLLTSFKERLAAV